MYPGAPIVHVFDETPGRICVMPPLAIHAFCFPRDRSKTTCDEIPVRGDGFESSGGGPTD